MTASFRRSPQDRDSALTASTSIDTSASDDIPVITAVPGRPVPQGHRRLAVRWVQLVSGTLVMGAGIAMLVRAHLGLVPLDVLHSAVAARTGWTFGGGLIATQAVLLALFVPLRIRPGVGTIAGFLVPAVTCDSTLTVLPVNLALPWRIAMLAGGGGLFAGGVALYLGTQFGAMPRDGLMLALAAGRPHRIPAVRVGLDFVFLIAGWLLLGPTSAVGQGIVGVGSLLLALTTGPAIGWLLPLTTRVADPLTARRATPGSAPPDGAKK
jgi:uncharacterized membrane protein YczE